MSDTDPEPARPERRASFRVPVTTDVVVQGESGPARSGVTLNIGLGGVAFVIPTAVAVDEMVTLRMQLEGEQVVTGAEVRHCTQTPTGYVVGCRFAGPKAAVERRVAAVVAVQDRRTSLRAAVGVAVEYRRTDSGEPFRPTASTDISAGGIRFALVSPLYQGDRVDLRVMFEMDRIPLEGVVVRIDHAGEQWHAAAMFDEARCPRMADLRAAVRRFLDTYPHVTD